MNIANMKLHNKNEASETEFQTIRKFIHLNASVSRLQSAERSSSLVGAKSAIGGGFKIQNPRPIILKPQTPQITKIKANGNFYQTKIQPQKVYETPIEQIEQRVMAIPDFTRFFIKR